MPTLDTGILGSKTCVKLRIRSLLLDVCPCFSMSTYQLHCQLRQRMFSSVPFRHETSYQPSSCRTSLSYQLAS
jgi:hypothetical protein